MVARIAVVELLAWGKIKWSIFVVSKKLSGRDRHDRFFSEIRNVGIVRYAGGMRQQVLDRDRLPRGGAFSDIFANRVARAEFASLLQKHYCSRRKLLRDR